MGQVAVVDETVAGTEIGKIVGNITQPVRSRSRLRTDGGYAVVAGSIVGEDGVVVYVTRAVIEQVRIGVAVAGAVKDVDTGVLVGGIRRLSSVEIPRVIPPDHALDAVAGHITAGRRGPGQFHLVVTRLGDKVDGRIGQGNILGETPGVGAGVIVSAVVVIDHLEANAVLRFGHSGESRHHPGGVSVRHATVVGTDKGCPAAGITVINLIVNGIDIAIVGSAERQHRRGVVVTTISRAHNRDNRVIAVGDQRNRRRKRAFDKIVVAIIERISDDGKLLGGTVIGAAA